MFENIDVFLDLFWYFPEAYLEAYQTYKMEFFTKIVNGFQLLTVFGKSFILDVLMDSEYTLESSYF